MNDTSICVEDTATLATLLGLPAPDIDVRCGQMRVQRVTWSGVSGSVLRVRVETSSTHPAFAAVSEGYVAIVPSEWTWGMDTHMTGHTVVGLGEDYAFLAGEADPEGVSLYYALRQDPVMPRFEACGWQA